MAGLTGTGAIAVEIPDNKLQQLKFKYIPPSTDKEIGPEGGNLSVDKCSLTIPPKSRVNIRSLSISMLMDFQNLSLPADMMPVSPYLDVKFCGKLRIPAKARIPTWFSPPEDSDHGIKIYKRYRDEENKFAWRELQNEVAIHGEIIEFEVDHCCGFIALIKDQIWGNGVIKLSHGLFHHGENFLSAICYRSPESLFQQMIAHLEKVGYEEIFRNRFVMKSTQEVPIRMECFDPPLHEFEPQQYLLTPSVIRANEHIQFPFLLQHLKEPQDAVKIKYIVDDFLAPFKVRLSGSKEPRSDGNTTQPICKNCSSQVCSNMSNSKNIAGTTAQGQAIAPGRDINNYGGVLVFCSISVLFLCFFLLLLFGLLPRFLQSYSTGHDEI